jgi:hypothetical protein
MAQHSLADIESRFIQKQRYLQAVSELLLLCDDAPKHETLQFVGSLMLELSKQTESLFLECLDFAIKNK